MRRPIIALAVALLAAAPALASDATDVTATVQHFIDAFNKGDVAAAVAACAADASVLDEFPPYAWHGAGACATWASAFDADAKKNGITDSVVTMGKPLHADVAGDRAYVVAPVGYTFKKKGVPAKETGSILTVALQKVGSGWKITGWSWAKH